jgi:hypothetical protein
MSLSVIEAGTKGMERREVVLRGRVMKYELSELV